MFVIFSTGRCLVFGRAEETAELEDGPTGCGEVARGGCSFAWNVSVTRSALLTEVETRTRTNLTLSLHQRLAPSLTFENSTGLKPCSEQ